MEHEWNYLKDKYKERLDLVVRKAKEEKRERFAKEVLKRVIAFDMSEKMKQAWRDAIKQVHNSQK